MKHFKQIVNRNYPVTTAVLLLIMLNFIALNLVHLGRGTTVIAIYDFGGILGQAIQADKSQLWRLFSAMFVHIGLEHLAFNGLAIYFLGRQMELLLGSLRFALIYFLSGLMGNVFVLALTPNVVTAGASTAIFGMFASLVVLRYFVRNPYIQNLGQSYLVLLALNLIMGFLSPGISMAGHIGGAVGGALCAVFIPIRGEEAAFSRQQRLLALLVYFLLLISLIWRGLGF